MRFLLFLLFCFPLFLQAQTEPAPLKLVEEKAEDLSDDFSAPLQHFQLYLKQPAEEIKLLQYDKDKEPIEGELSEGGNKIILKDYYKKGRVFVDVLYKDGTRKTFSVGSCFIDPIFEL